MQLIKSPEQAEKIGSVAKAQKLFQSVYTSAAPLTDLVSFDCEIRQISYFIF